MHEGRLKIEWRKTIMRTVAMIALLVLAYEGLGWLNLR